METSSSSARTSVGRKMDRSRDSDILSATLDVLADEGYERMTMDAVAERAKAGKATIYRRWSSKAALLLDAVAYMKRTQVEQLATPDTGSLRGDLLALYKPLSAKERERRMRIMAGLSSLLAQEEKLVEAGMNALVEPWANAYRFLIQRAVERGEVAKPADLETLVRVVPSMAVYRTLIQRKAFDREFLLSMVDGVVLPALGLKSITERKFV